VSVTWLITPATNTWYDHNGQVLETAMPGGLVLSPSP
jgi:hypothetical protein